jgi:hypothetical protein
MTHPITGFGLWRRKRSWQLTMLTPSHADRLLTARRHAKEDAPQIPQVTRPLDRLAWAVTAFLLTSCGSGRVATGANYAAPLPLGVTGTVRFHGGFRSKFVAPRNVEVWLPPTYDREPVARYPVIYVHDGQNAFAPATSFAHVDWGLDEAMMRLIAQKRGRLP